MLKTEPETFFQAILDQPDDDHLRLIFADWLEERGDPRGEFIRIQHALLDPSLNDDQRYPLLVCERELRCRHEAEWLGPLAEILHGWEFRRGLVEEATLAAAAFLEHAPALFAAAPVRHIKLLNARELMPELGLCPYLGRLTGLDLSGNDVSDVETEYLAGSPHLGRLAYLDLSMNLIELGGVKALAKSSGLAALTALNLSQNTIGDMGAYNLAASMHLTGLTSLTLRFGDIGPGGADYLAKSSRLEGLRSLDLSHNPIGDAGVRSLAGSPHLGALTTLRLNGCGLGGLGVQALIRSAQFSQLARFELAENSIGIFQRQALTARFGSVVSF
jgi:uncharacterized protein (TIGR02996 family)